MEASICYLIVYIIEALIAWQFFSNLYIKKRGNFMQLGCFLSSYIGVFSISLINVFWLNVVAFLFVNMILAIFLYDAPMKSRLFFPIIMTALMCITELVVVVIMGVVHEDFGAYKKELIYLILSAILCKTVYFLLLQIILKIFTDRQSEQRDKNKMVVLLCFIPCVSLWITINFVFLGLYGRIPGQFEWMTIVSAMLLLVVNLISFGVYSYTQKTNRDYLNVQLQLQKEYADKNYYQLLSKQSEDQKILIHDIKKHLSAVYALIDGNNLDKAKQYIQTITSTKELKLALAVSDNDSLNMLLAHYQNICDTNGIRFEIDIRKNSLEEMLFEDITSIFGNLLENAVEACSEIENSYIDLGVRKTDQGQCLITMINSCIAEPRVLTDGTFESIKRDKTRHGIGMKSIRKVVKKYGGNMTAYYNAVDCTFHMVICLQDYK